MASFHKRLSLCGAVGAAVIACASTAMADGYEYEGKAMAAPNEERKFTYSFSLTGTSDYVFRGVSQTDNDPTFQAAIDLSYGIFYIGAWGSGVDYGPSTDRAEIDYYGGINPTWNNLEFDFGVIYYTYMGGFTKELLELKAPSAEL